jgi:hypothetical protein
VVNLPIADINDGITSGMMMHLSMLRKRWPMYPTYMASLSNSVSKMKIYLYKQCKKYHVFK